MGDVDRLPSGKWQARTRVDGRQVKRSFRTKADAQAWLAQKAVERSQGLRLDERAGRVPLAVYAAEYVAARPYRSSTASNRAVQVAALAGDLIGAVPLNRIRPGDVQRFATRYGQDHARSTTSALVGFLRSVMRAAVEDRLIGVNPVGRVALPTLEAAPVVPLAVAQVRAVVDALPEPLAAAAAVQATTGLRIGELLGLQLVDVDFLRRELHVRLQVHPRDRVLVPLKTPWSARTVPLPDVAGDTLARHLAGRPAVDGWLFTDERGRPFQHERFTRTLRPHGVVSHDFRHHYASVLLAAGESVVGVARRLGHKDASLVISTYGHLLPDSEERTRRAVDSAWCAPDVPAEAPSVL